MTFYLMTKDLPIESKLILLVALTFGLILSALVSHFTEGGR